MDSTSSKGCVKVNTIQIPKEIQELQQNSIPATQVAGFSCKGCGAICCFDKSIVLSPPEFLRISWHLQRNGGKNIDPAKWAQMHIGHSSGLPLLTIQNIELSNGSNVCPFLKKVPGIHQLATCEIHSCRPIVCRIYPFGRMKFMRDFDIHKCGDVSYTKSGQCPGFQSPQADETILIGYKPIDLHKTVEEWVLEQIPQELRDERDYWQDEVLPRFIEKRLVSEDVGGLLTNEKVFDVGSILYPLLRTPEDPAIDHKIITIFLQGIAEFTDHIVENLEEERSERS